MTDTPENLRMTEAEWRQREADAATATKRLARQAAAHESWARTPDRSARTRPARTAFEQRFLDEASGDPVRAESLRRAYFARLALASAKARRQRDAPPDATAL